MEKVQAWWEGIGPEHRLLVQNGGIVLAVLVVGHLAGWIVTRILTSRNFDAVLRGPGSAGPHPDGEREFTASFMLGVLVRLSVWAGAGWWLARQAGKVEWANTIQLVVYRTWAATGILLAALAVAGLIARRLVECLGMLPGPRAEPAPIRTDASPARWNPAGVVGAASYLLVLLLVLLTVADVFDLPLTRSAAMALWQFAQHALIAGAAFFIGCLGARWAQGLATPDTATTPEKRAGQYTALGIMAATTILAVAVLLSGAGLLLALLTLMIVGFSLYLVRDYLPDVTAGLQLRSHKVRELWFEGEAWQVVSVGFLTTEVSRRGEFHHVQNRIALEVCMHGAPAQTEHQ